jgi:multidrug efflux system membrane fusion protein
MLAAGCGRSGETSGARQLPPVPILAARATQRPVLKQLHEIGTVEAYATVNIKSRVEGNLVAIAFQQGDFVRKGQLLFTLDPRPFRAALQQAEANLARDEAQRRQALVDARRYAFLAQQGVGSRQQADQSQASADTWVATVAADEAAVETARLNLLYSEIRSPIDGHSGNLQAHIGDLIKPDADTPLVTITQIQPVYVDLSIPEANLAEVRAAMEQQQLKVEAFIPGMANGQLPPEQGVLSFIDNTVDKTTGTILLKGLFANRDRRLWPGAYVNTVLTLGVIPDAVVVPSEAVENGPQGNFVFVVGADNRVQMRPVVVGSQVDGATVIERGLRGGETVVTDGQLRLLPGSAVTVKQTL